MRSVHRAAWGLAVSVILVGGMVLVAQSRTSDVLDISVRKNQLVNGNGESVELVGVNRSGAEYTCVIQDGAGAGVFSGPSDDASIARMKSWHINSVRIPLNEDCWLGINGVNPAFSGQRYRDAIAQFVRRLNNAGLIVVLDLHWNAPGSTLALKQQIMADADHAPAFWTSVATVFRDNHAMLFDLFNEPTSISWSCWQSGCQTKEGWRTAGMQSLIDAVRATGADQPIVAAGINNANDLSEWLAYPLNDPRHQLVAGIHMYDQQSSEYCGTVTCWDRTIGAVAARVPVLTSELGESDRRSDFITSYLDWMTHQWSLQRGISVTAWSWDPALGEGGPSLVISSDGAPTSYGAGFRAYLEGMFQRGEIHRG